MSEKQEIDVKNDVKFEELPEEMQKELSCGQEDEEVELNE